jgi:UDP-4-amino-4,6-dideoxy-N-acetyl-beta-L-altrosamine transaminase
MIPYGRQHVTDADIEAVVDVLRSDFLTQGPAVPAFELAVAAQVGVRHALAVNSATSALHIACLALGLGPGDRLWTVPNTEVDFVDIDPDSWNLSVTALKAKLVQARQDGLLPKVLVPVHFGGQPTDQEAIWALAQEFGFRVLEDASHAIGASRHGERAGNCTWSDITVLSFHPVKIITTGEGGMALTNDAELAGRMEMLRSHGITRDAAKFTQAAPGPWHYEQQALGFNYRMTDIQAALGSSQLARLDSYVERRNLLARRYDELLRGLPLQLPVVLAGNRSAFHLYVVRVKSNPHGRTREQVFSELRQGGIGVNVHYMPVHLQPYYRQLGFANGAFPVAESYASEAITLPLYPQLTEEGQDQVVSILARALT